MKKNTSELFYFIKGYYIKAKTKKYLLFEMKRISFIICFVALKRAVCGFCKRQMNYGSVFT